MSPPRALYLHFPFCRRKCPYCDFYSVAGQTELLEPYLEALLADLRWTAAEFGGGAIDTVYLGGGTPTVFPPERLAAVLDACRTCSAVSPEAEVTCECNPGTVDLSALRRLRAAGVNRLSLGVQSFRDEELRFLGRIHSAAEAREAALEAREAGFDNLSLDLISCLPGQTLGAWEASLEAALALQPDHVSAYCLQIEEGTPLAQRAAAGEVTPVAEDEQADSYARTIEVLEAGGRRQYEVSNFAVPGAECRHNLTYWRNEAYLGVGAGAWSFADGERRRQVADVAAYVRAWRAGAPEFSYRERCTGATAANETIMMALRMREGLSLAAFRERHGRDLGAAREEAVRRLAAQGLARLEGGRLALTARGMAVAGEITAILAFAEEE